jgi:hypothetical protein
LQRLDTIGEELVGGSELIDTIGEELVGDSGWYVYCWQTSVNYHASPMAGYQEGLPGYPVEMALDTLSTR